MLACQFIDPGLGVEKGDNKIRGHWFWNSVLRHQLRTSTWDSGKFQAEPVRCCFFFLFFFSQQKKLQLVLSTCTFMHWLLDSSARYTHRLASRTDYVFDQWSVVSFVIKSIFVHLLMANECIWLIKQMYFLQIHF